ncbi:unnamed protein product [Cochlearia groenlandica]
MGCCLSAGKVKAPPISAVSAAQIPPPIEEESVKEVVVQTVSVPSTAPAVPSTAPTTVPTAVPAVPVAELVATVPIVLDSEPNLLPTLQTPEISQTKSDICSVSHSFSTTATTATAASILEDDALSKLHRPPPPPRRSRPDRIYRSPRESPQSKLRPRLTRERQQPQRPSQQNPNLNRRNIDSGLLPKTGLLDSQRRRSRSPATRGPSNARKSPMKKREDVKVDVEVKKEEANVDVEIKKEDLAVKDPEVSMECFIFL